MDPITFALGVASSIVAAIIYDMAKSKLRSNQFVRPKHLPQSKSIFSVAKDKANSVVSRILPGNNEPILLQLNYKKIGQSNQSGTSITLGGVSLLKKI